MLHNKFNISVEICFITASRQYVSPKIQSMIILLKGFYYFSSHFSSCSIGRNGRNVNYNVVKDAYRTVALLQYIRMDELWNFESVKHDNFNINIDNCNQFANKRMI